MSVTASSVLEVRDIVCQREAASLRAAHAAFDRGRVHFLIGEADSGHELLLRVLGLLEVPQSGEVLVDGESMRDRTEEGRLKVRERRLGFVFTAPFLLPAFTVIENVAMPLFKVSDVEPAEARRRSDVLLDFTGLLDLAEIPCVELAPFEQQRVSLARALVNEPAALLIESLDAALAGEDLRVFTGLLRQAATRFGIAVIATASPRFVPESGDRIVEVTDGVASSSGKLWPQTDA